MNVIDDIKNGVLDCNNQELFLKILIKGLIIDLNKEIKIRNISVPHIIRGFGNEVFFIKNKGYDASKEPLDITNEDYIYNTIPRCMIETQNIDMISDQLTSPYTRGIFEYIYEDELYTLSAEFRRIPLKINIELKYYTDTFSDMMEIIQQMISKLMFVRKFNITYMGNVISCSYKIPESFQDEHTFEFTGDMQDNTYKNMQLSLEVETNMPVFSNKTVTNSGKIITNCDPAKKGNAYNILIKESAK